MFGKKWVFAVKKACRMVSVSILSGVLCGRSSVVERHVANVNVVSSNLIARFFMGLRGVNNGVFYSFCEVPANLLVRRWSH